jgi:hypothetical protein
LRRTQTGVGKRGLQNERYCRSFIGQGLCLQQRLLSGLIRYLPGFGALYGLGSRSCWWRVTVGTAWALEKESEHVIAIR